MSVTWYIVTLKYNDDETQIILKTKIAKVLFIKMLDDAYLTSELTHQFYESKAKDTVLQEENIESSLD